MSAEVRQAEEFTGSELGQGRMGKGASADFYLRVLQYPEPALLKHKISTLKQ